MSAPYRQLDVEHLDHALCVHIREPKLPLNQLEELLADLDKLVAEVGGAKVVLLLGPHDPECLYSMFLAKLISVQKRLRQAGGALVLAGASEEVKEIFAACRLLELFDFKVDREAALQSLKAS